MEKQEQEERKHLEALDRKIERLQEKVIKKHKEYSVLAEKLSALLDERHPERKIKDSERKGKHHAYEIPNHAQPQNALRKHDRLADCHADCRHCAA